MAMTTQQLLNKTQREVTKMTEGELRKAVSILRSTARKRYERLVESEIYSPAAQYMVKSARGQYVLPTVKNLSVSELKNEYKRYKTFLQMKTSTVSGTKKAKKAQKEATETLIGRELTDEEITDLWQMVDELQNTDVGGVLNYKQISETVSDIMIEHPDFSKVDILDLARNRLVEIYENESSNNFTSRFMQ